MSVRTLATQFVDLCNQGKYFDVMRAMYAPDIVSVEGTGQQTAGKQPVIHKSEVWQANNTIHGGKVRGPFFCGGTDSAGQFAVYFTIDVTPKSTGQRITLEEVGLYTVTTRSPARNSSTTAHGSESGAPLLVATVAVACHPEGALARRGIWE